MSAIQDFYRGQTVLITGGTGFLGKLVTEKLLRTCDLNRVYLLLRPKHNKNLEERFSEIFRGACFDNLKALKPDFLQKVRLINGDCSEQNLALSPEDQEMLKDEVTCVIHSAANVRFDTDLKLALSINVRAVKAMLDLTREMRNVRAFVYVSTAFSHCVRKCINEEFYEVDIKPEKVLQMAEVMDEKTMNIVTPHLLGEWPNTYVYTKALAEEVIRGYKQQLPVAIVRPAVVLSSNEEPIPGWVEGFHGVLGVILGVSLGVLRSLHLDSNATAPLVPADYVVNAILASAWNVEEIKKNNQNEIPIYNMTPNDNNSVTWGWFIKYFQGFTFVYPLSDSVWYNYIQTSKYKVVHKVRSFFYHILFAYLVDTILFIIGKRTLAVEKYTKILKLIDLLSFFTTSSWRFGTENINKLWKKLSDKDKEIYYFNMEQLDWKKYLVNCIVGGRIVLMKDPLETIPKAKRKMHLLRVVHYLFVALVCYFWYCFFLFVFNVFFKHLL